MEVLVEIPDKIAKKIVDAQNAKIEKEPDEFERARMSIHSDHDIVKAHIQVLAKFFHDGRLVFATHKS